MIELLTGIGAVISGAGLASVAVVYWGILIPRLLQRMGTVADRILTVCFVTWISSVALMALFAGLERIGHGSGSATMAAIVACSSALFAMTAVPWMLLTRHHLSLLSPTPQDKNWHEVNKKLESRMTKPD